MGWGRCARIALAVVLALAVTACSGSAAHSKAAPASYYLALGDSLSQGVQPNAAGTSVETGQGYANQVYATLLPDHPGLRLVKLGCPGETTSTMIHGGICRYRGGSQLAAAAAFLRAHRAHMFLVTIDIGANDPEDCGKGGLSEIAHCYVTDIPGSVSNLGTIMSRLRAAAGQAVRIVGMSYYLPALAEWRDGFGGEELARFIARLATSYNNLLDHVYGQYDAPVANVFGAFDTSNFGDAMTVPGIGTLPRNVALICRWTWECAAPPRGPNQHANRAGYAVIARVFLGAAGLS